MEEEEEEEEAGPQLSKGCRPSRTCPSRAVDVIRHPKHASRDAQTCFIFGEHSADRIMRQPRGAVVPPWTPRSLRFLAKTARPAGQAGMTCGTGG